MIDESKGSLVTCNNTLNTAFPILPLLAVDGLVMHSATFLKEKVTLRFDLNADYTNIYVTFRMLSVSNLEQLPLPNNMPTLKTSEALIVDYYFSP